MNAGADTREAQLLRALSRGPSCAEDLKRRLGVSQATLSRTIQQTDRVEGFRVPGQRTPLYGAHRQPAGIGAQQAIYRVGTTGAIKAAGRITFLARGQTLWQDERIRLFDRLPPSRAFAAPAGFLGRIAAQQAGSAVDVPSRLNDWSDDHRAAFLCTMGSDIPGDLIFGIKPLEMAIAQRRREPVDAANKPDVYRARAQGLRETSVGSSAGGEQPKFLEEVRGLGHVIVKFAKKGTRIADLLAAEHLALSTLRSHHIPAAQTDLLHDRDYVYLEVLRFDRIGRHGRRGMISAGAYDDEAFGQRDNWSNFAQRCRQARVLNDADVFQVNQYAAFSTLIANTDTHFDNLSLLLDESGEVSGIAPAYDILPMRYAPLGGGIDPALLPVEPKIAAIGGDPQVWKTAGAAALDFWGAVQSHKARLISASFKALARKNAAVVKDFLSAFGMH